MRSRANIWMDKFSSHDDQDELFDKEFIPLDQARAEQMFTPQSLRQQVKSPWEIVQLQVITTFWFTIIAVIWSFIETNNQLVVLQQLSL